MRTAYLTTNNLFNPALDFFKTENTKKAFSPAVDVEETEKSFLFSFDLPGVPKDEVKIEVVENQLTVSGERKSVKRDDSQNQHISERYLGSFKRVFTLGSNIDATKVAASYTDGVLQIEVPKAEDSKPRLIKVS